MARFKGAEFSDQVDEDARPIDRELNTDWRKASVEERLITTFAGDPAGPYKGCLGHRAMVEETQPDPPSDLDPDFWPLAAVGSAALQDTAELGKTHAV